MRRIFVAAAVVLAFFVGFSLSQIGGFYQEANAEKTVSAEKSPAPGASNSGDIKNLFVDLSRRFVPSVVNIFTTQTIANPYGGMNNPQADLYRRFFENFFGEDFPGGPNGGGNGGMGVQPRKATSLGTGFIIDEKEGLLLTNYHVVADAEEIKIVLTEQDTDQEGIDAKVVGSDAEADVALLKIKTKRPLKAITFGDSDALQVGEWVMAIGNPFGHGHTVTHGIISAKERIVPISQFSNFLQTDAPINPGNSGGPLINTDGLVVGINTAINAAAQGIGFATPINYVKKILPELRTKGAVTRGFIGVNIAEITPALAKHLKLDKGVHGVLISEVFEGEPAAKAGLLPYDVVTEVNGKKVEDGRHLVSSISGYAPGATISVKALRKGKEKNFDVVVGKRPTRETVIKAQSGKASKPAKPKINIGMTVEEMDADVKRELGLPPAVSGVVVAKVSPGSAAEDAGFQRGDVIVEVDQSPTPDVNTFYALINEEKEYVIRVHRGEGFTITTLDLSAPKKK